MSKILRHINYTLWCFCLSFSGILLEVNACAQGTVSDPIINRTSQKYDLPQPILFGCPDFERINGIEEDKNGLVWLSTNRGLFCFDGTVFRKIIHSPQGYSAVDAGQINDLFLDKEQQQLWLATDAGASKLDLKTEVFTDYTFYQKEKPGWANGECISVLKDRGGVVWFGMMGFGLVSLDTALHYFPMPKDAASSAMRDYPTIFQIVQDVREDSIYWLAFSRGLARFYAPTGSYKVFTPSLPNENLANFIPTALFPTNDKVYLGGTWTKGGLIYDIARGNFMALENKNPRISGLPLKLGVFQYRSPSTIWGATDDGLVIINTQGDSLDGSFPNRFNSSSESHNFLATPDRLWLGSAKGLLLYDFNRYTVENHYIEPDSGNFPGILRCTIEKEGGSRLLLGFQFSHFIYDYDRGSRTFTAIPRHKKNTQWAPTNLTRLNDGRLLATGAEGIFELRDNRLIYLPLMEEIFASRGDLAVCRQDSDGTLWLNSRFGGFYKMDLNTGRYRDCLAGRYFLGTPLVFMDSRENFWLSGNGFSVYNPKTDSLVHIPFKEGEMLTSSFPRGYEEDDQGNIWISDIRVGGLMMVDPRHLEKGVIKRFEAMNGSLSNQMWGLKKDSNGRIWSVSQAGLQVFDPEKGTFRLFDEAVGLHVREKERYDGFNLTLSNLTRLSTGEMVVGYRHGFAIFHPDSLAENRELPKPYLISVKANEVDLFEGNSFGSSYPFRLKPDQDVLEFEFSSIAYYDPNKITYCYRLKNYEEGWNETTWRYVRYTHLPAGSYTFQLWVFNGDGNSADFPLEWHFRILSPWWARWWAYLGYSLVFFTSVFAFIQYRKRQALMKALMEEEHREAERLKELDTLKTRLYTNITHEFRTPLTIILGMVDQLKTDFGDWKLGAIQRSGKSLLRLVNQMLDLSKLESGAMPVHFIKGDIIPFLKYQLESFHSLAEGKGLLLEFQSDLPAFVLDYDPEKIESILSNLLSNALKFTTEGFVRLVISFEEERFLLIRVIDSGPGIPAEKRSFIFDRFYQVEGDTTRSAEGTGIGLAVTKELVKLLGGTISVNSEPGVGTEFIVSLPITRNATRVQTEIPVSVSDEVVSGVPDVVSPDDVPILLVVEDHADVVLYLQSILQDKYKITIAKNGHEGLAKALELIPDIILSDVMMPEMDGLELCEILKTDIRTSHIPIVMLTAKADMASKIEGLRHGADAYLAKPFEKTELFVRLEKLVELRKRLQERYANAGAGVDPLTKPTLEDTFIQQVRSILEAHLGDEDFGISELCKATGMSRAQLYRKFQALTDQPVGQYFRTLRLHKAKELLKDAKLQVSEIAYQVGFKDPAHFTRAFSEEFGMSPREWRKR